LCCLYREIEIESDDETLYQSKRSSQIKRDQHSSLPDLTETLDDDNNTLNNDENSDHIQPSSAPTNSLLSPTSPNSKQKSINKEKIRKEIFNFPLF
jgi:hypothetical protein